MEGEELALFISCLAYSESGEDFVRQIDLSHSDRKMEVVPHPESLGK